MRLPVLMVLFACGCPHGGVPSSGPQLTVAEVVDRLAKARAELTGFRADSTMDYWLKNQRVKGEVLVMGTTGAHVRFAALSPAGGSTMAEMACDGASFAFVDYQKNCTLSGPCDRNSIAQFFGIPMEPDDFVHLALGTPPVIANAQGTVKWDADKGVQRVELTGAAGKQTLAIDTKDAHFDVLESQLLDPDGKVVWSVSNTDFTDAGGHRVPGKSRFKAPSNQQDLLVEWGSSHEINPQIDPAKFQITVPQGLSPCH